MLELVLKEVTRVPVDKTKVVRIQGVKENGEEIYLGRHEHFVSIVIQEENQEDK